MSTKKSNHLIALRQFCLFGLPLCLITSMLCHFYFELGQWANYAYILTLTANIGYFTNFIAIKMLFKPYQPTAFGRQGLIPKNKTLLSQSLSQTLSEHFLSEQHWLDYFTEAKLVPLAFDKTQTYLQLWLQDDKNQTQCFEIIQKIIDNNRLEINQYAQKIESQVLQYLANNIDLNQTIDQLIDWLEQAFEKDPQKMMQWIDPIITAIAENVPQIAEQLLKSIDQQIEKQSVLKRGIAKAAKWSVDITDEDIKNYLFHLLASQEFRQTLFNGLHSLVKQYRDKSLEEKQSQNREENSFDLEALFKKIIDKLVSNTSAPEKTILANESTMCFSEQRSKNYNKNWADWLKYYVSNENKQRKIIAFINQALPKIFNGVKPYVENKKIQQKFYQGLVRLIQSLNLSEAIERKASEFSAEKMHQIFDNILSKHLIFIELLGALLGGLSGLALINVHLLALVIIAGLLLLGLETLLTRRKNYHAET